MFQRALETNSWWRICRNIFETRPIRDMSAMSFVTKSDNRSWHFNLRYFDLPSFALSMLFNCHYDLTCLEITEITTSHGSNPIFRGFFCNWIFLVRNNLYLRLIYLSLCFFLLPCIEVSITDCDKELFRYCESRVVELLQNSDMHILSFPLFISQSQRLDSRRQATRSQSHGLSSAANTNLPRYSMHTTR